jgi:hypothetical protein
MREKTEGIPEAAWQLFAATGLPEAYLLSRWSAQWEGERSQRRNTDHPKTRP